MRNWLVAVLLCGCLGGVVHGAQLPPVPDHPPPAQTSLGFNASSRCPDLRMDDEGTVAVVVFWLSRSGIASHISVKSSSGSKALDDAAAACVSKLRFAPKTTIGSGDPVDSWQQAAFRWTDHGAANETRAAAEATAKSQDESNVQGKSATVHVCVDETGKLKQDPTIVHSSGVASVDQAAVKIAASGSAYYRSDKPSGGAPATGCAQLTIRFDAK
jgi:TonB family protein